MDDKTKDLIDEIRNKCDIVDVISRHIEVTKKGRGYWAVCPFHNDTKPSLSISPEKQIFKCFACNESGNVFKFVQKFKNVSYMMAIKEVADLVGVDFKLHEKKIEDPKLLKNKSLFDILEDAKQYYKNNLLSNQKALEYCTSRNLNQEIINTFNLGYSDSKQGVINYLLTKGYKKEDIYNSSLANEINGELVDFFENRLIFPLSSIDGHVVAFSGRILEKIEGVAKYKNSNETEIFSKSNVLYNYFNALEHIKKEKRVFVVEGYMDVIAMYKAGFKNTIAIMGTALTKEHIRLLKFLGVEVVVSLDGDVAGMTNASRAISELIDNSINVSAFNSYQNSKDLDELYSKLSKDEFVSNINNNIISGFDYIIQTAQKLELLSNNDDKKKFLKKMCLKISAMNELDQDIYISMLHDKLGFSTAIIKSLVNESKSADTTVQYDINEYKKFNKTKELEIRILSNMLDSKEAIDIFVKSNIFFKDANYRAIANMICDYYLSKKDELNIDMLIADIYTKISIDYEEDDSLSKVLSEIDSCKESYPKYNVKSFNDMIYEINEILPLEERLEQIKENIQFENDLAKKIDLIKETVEIKDTLSKKRKSR